MKSLEEIRVRVGAALLGRIPELFLGRISIHGTYLDKAVAELFRRIVEVARLWAHHGTVIDQAARGQTETKLFEGRPASAWSLTTYPSEPRKPQTVPSA